VSNRIETEHFWFGALRFRYPRRKKEEMASVASRVRFSAAAAGRASLVLSTSRGRVSPRVAIPQLPVRRLSGATLASRSSEQTKGKAKKLSVLLLQDVEKLGYKAEVVSVKRGYFRNFLHPKGLATFATRENISLLGQPSPELIAARNAQARKQAAQKRLAKVKKICTFICVLLSFSGAFCVCFLPSPP
jgi:Ribosomal protein L9, N-terminal domain